MPTYSAIAGSELAVNKPLTSSLMTRLSDNPLAIFEQLGWATTVDVFISPEQTITVAGTVTVNHGLTSFSPTNGIVQVFLICKTGELGYSANDVVPFSPSGQGSSGSTGISTTLSATQVVIRYGSSGLNLTRADTGAAGGMTEANWRLVVTVRG